MLCCLLRWSTSARVEGRGESKGGLEDESGGWLGFDGRVTVDGWWSGDERKCGENCGGEVKRLYVIV